MYPRLTWPGTQLEHFRSRVLGLQGCTATPGLWCDEPDPWPRPSDSGGDGRVVFKCLRLAVFTSRWRSRCPWPLFHFLYCTEMYFIIYIILQFVDLLSLFFGGGILLYVLLFQKLCVSFGPDKTLPCHCPRGVNCGPGSLFLWPVPLIYAADGNYRNTCLLKRSPGSGQSTFILRGCCLNIIGSPSLPAELAWTTCV